MQALYQIRTSMFTNADSMQATNHQKRNTKRKIILLLLLVIVGLIIGVTIKASRKNAT